jgi:hypothetical protein
MDLTRRNNSKVQVRNTEFLRSTEEETGKGSQRDYYFGHSWLFVKNWLGD